MFAHALADGRLVTIEEMADSTVFRAHLMKVANTLTRAGYLTGVRGRSGLNSERGRRWSIVLGMSFGDRTDFVLLNAFELQPMCDLPAL